MKEKIVALVVLTTITLTGCFFHSKDYWAFEKEKISNCRKRWIYKDLSEKRKIRVLLFIPTLNRDISSYPNFILGVTETNDTAAYLDKNFIGVVKKGELINVLPYNWSSTDKEINKPLFVMYKKSNINNLFCNVDTVYYCKLEKVNDSN